MIRPGSNTFLNVVVMIILKLRTEEDETLSERLT